jgi:hypothetical protein
MRRSASPMSLMDSVENVGRERGLELPEAQGLITNMRTHTSKPGHVRSVLASVSSAALAYGYSVSALPSTSAMAGMNRATPCESAMSPSPVCSATQNVPTRTAERANSNLCGERSEVCRSLSEFASLLWSPSVIAGGGLQRSDKSLKKLLRRRPGTSHAESVGRGADPP